jgi:hypothetical protein
MLYTLYIYEASVEYSKTQNQPSTCRQQYQHEQLLFPKKGPDLIFK